MTSKEYDAIRKWCRGTRDNIRRAKDITCFEIDYLSAIVKVIFALLDDIKYLQKQVAQLQTELKQER